VAAGANDPNAVIITPRVMRADRHPAAGVLAHQASGQADDETVWTVPAMQRSRLPRLSQIIDEGDMVLREEIVQHCRDQIMYTMIGE
jgi:hypothetical protein